jgi:apolipoprotein N-acyltransferase
VTPPVWFRDRPWIAYFVLAALTGVLLQAAFPPLAQSWLAPFALVPLLIAAAQARAWWQAFSFGWLTGIVYWFGLCVWIEFVLQEHGGLPGWLAWLSFLLFCVLKALHLAVFAGLASSLMHRSYALVGVPLLWVGLERTHGTFGFAWLALGNAGIDMSYPLRLAPFVGVYGLSFLFALLATALACVALGRPRRWLIPLALLVLLPLLPRVQEAEPAPERALVVQPNVDPEQEWTEAYRRSFEAHLIRVSIAVPVQLVVWPELPAPLYFFDDPEFEAAAKELAIRQQHFLFGTVAYTANKEPLNSAVLIGPDGNVAGRYDKIYLVPFGEFVPRAFSWVNRISHEIGDFVPGNSITVMQAGEAGRLGVFICYESAFPHLVRQFARNGADVLFNLSNDAYFGRSAAYRQHLNLVRMRAVENRRFVVRVTDDGITAAIDPAGRIRAELPRYRESAAIMPYGRVQGTTFYTRNGDWFAWSALGIGVALSGVARWRRTA